MSNLSVVINEVLARLMSLEIELLSSGELESSMMDSINEIICYLKELTFWLEQLVNDN